MAILLREGSSIFDAMKQIIQGIPLNQAVSSIIPNSNYANQVIGALSGAHGADYLKIAYIVDVFPDMALFFTIYGRFGKFHGRDETYRA